MTPYLLLTCLTLPPLLTALLTPRHEYDYFELRGTNTSTDSSAVNWYGGAQWDVVYVPGSDSAGLDSFTYSASDCPGHAENW